jgi:GT2 family glycosyltransferase
MNDAPRIAVGIATAGRPAQLALTLARLARQRRRPHRLIVCPAAADDIDLGALPPLDVHVVRGPRGLTAQRNRILDACGEADLLVFLDDDYYPADDYLAHVEHLFEAEPEVVVATSRPLLDGASGPGVDEATAAALVDALVPQPVGRLDLRPTYGGYGCNMALRLAPVRAGGLRFDESLPLYGWLEDIDFSRRLAPHGRIVSCAQLRGVHLGSKRGRVAGVRLGYSQVANPLYMMAKGSLSPAYGLRQMAANVAKNAWRAARPEPWVDRRGRLRGNLIALADLLRGRIAPGRIHQLG